MPFVKNHINLMDFGIFYWKLQQKSLDLQQIPDKVCVLITQKRILYQVDHG